MGHAMKSMMLGATLILSCSAAEASPSENGEVKARANLEYTLSRNCFISITVTYASMKESNTSSIQDDASFVNIARIYLEKAVTAATILGRRRDQATHDLTQGAALKVAGLKSSDANAVSEGSEAIKCIASLE